MTIDYRELLRKYIAHVCEEEGLTFIGSPYTNRAPSPFSEEEISELEALDAEISSDRQPLG